MNMKDKLWLAMVAVVFAVLGFVALYQPAPALANLVPEYGIQPFSTGTISSTADQDILDAPGSNLRWVVTSMSYNVLVEEADATVVVEDKAGTAINICELAPEVQGYGVTYDYEQGIVCSINSGVQVDFSGSTADLWITVTAYKEYVQ